MGNRASVTAEREAAKDLAELELVPVVPQDATELDDRVFVIGIRAESVR